MSQEMFEKGRRIRSEVLGKERVAKALEQYPTDWDHEAPIGRMKLLYFFNE